MAKSKVYFTKEISPAALVKMFNLTTANLTNRIAAKIHTGELGNKNYIRPELMSELIDNLGATFVECNTAYKGKRQTLADHLSTAQAHGFTGVDILDASGDIGLPVRISNHLDQNFVGANIKNYDSLLVLSHFKGHAMGGFGGALKNISIGLASARGKNYIHTAGKTLDYNDELFWGTSADDFVESMAEAASTIMDLFQNRIAFIDVMMNISVDCDCDGNAKLPEIDDIGILSSLDPIALDCACFDLLKNLDDPRKQPILDRIQSRHGDYILDYAEKLGIGSKDYELIQVD